MTPPPVEAIYSPPATMPLSIWANCSPPVRPQPRSQLCQLMTPAGLGHGWSGFCARSLGVGRQGVRAESPRALALPQQAPLQAPLQETQEGLQALLAHWQAHARLQTHRIPAYPLGFVGLVGSLASADQAGTPREAALHAP
mmetsp:Transcript_73641/g.163671  ORF Transcript_73641/g.163671 Transcript_73641/m.163671 type:complete len:141 (+) Transcript_73641:827-1249(+)